MSKRTACSFACAVLLGLGVFIQLPAQPQPTPAPGEVIDENSRLMQEYMVVRGEWIDLRRVALDAAAKAPDAAARRQILAKLAEDEKPVLARLAGASRAYRAFLKKRDDAIAAGRPRN